MIIISKQEVGFFLIHLGLIIRIQSSACDDSEQLAHSQADNIIPKTQKQEKYFLKRC